MFLWHSYTLKVEISFLFNRCNSTYCCKLESYVAPDTMKISESVVEAFIEKIWVSKDEFRWYLRRGNEKHRECSDADRIKIAEFQVNLEQAKAYQYSFSTRKRVYKWVDLNVSVWL